jgi:L,D-peptidoglycan transpeptidase YkuD (ErfK/YbiS/YcfS/YnhG family)
MRFLSVLSFVFCAMSLRTADLAPSNDPLSNSRQCLLVSTKEWKSSDGKIRLFERDRVDSAWRQLKSPKPVFIGKSGFGWGRGLIGTESLPGPRKKEGDGKAPAGIFRLISAFGYAPTCHTKLTYLALSPDIEAIEDPQSRYYNQLVARSKIASPDWRTSEHMFRADVRYKWGIVVAHNVPPQPGAGSCIFLHVWSDPPSPTVGCTAMSEETMVDLIGWLDPKKHPVLVQLPSEAYGILHDSWHLPPDRPTPFASRLILLR